MGDLLGRFFLALVGFLETSWGKWILFLLTPVLGFFGLVSKVCTMVNGYWNDMIDQSLDTMGNAVNVNAGVILAFGNSVVPLDTLFMYCGIAAEIFLLSLAYRAIKSWVPTLS